MYKIIKDVEKRDYIVAIDLGSSSATIAVGARDDDGRLDIIDIISQQTDGLSRGEIANRQEVIAVLQSLKEKIQDKHHISISDTYTGISGKHIKCTNQDYFVYVGERSDGEIRKEDKLALHDVMNNVQAEDGIKILDRIPQTYVIDGQEKVKDPVGRFGSKLASTFCFVLGSWKPIDRLEKALMGVGIKPIRTFANALSSALSVTTADEREMGVAVLDIGAGTSDLCIYYDDSVRFVRGIPFGASDINNDIKQQGILERYVEALKNKYGRATADSIEKDQLIIISGLKGKDQKKISQKNLAIIIENRLKDIISFVREEIADSGYADRLGAGLVLTGGCTLLPDIDTLFRRELNMDVRLATPDLYVNERSKEIASDPRYATVIGMLLRVMEAGQRSNVEVFKPINRYTAPQSRPAQEPVRKPEPAPKPAAEPQSETTVSGWGKAEQTPLPQEPETEQREETESDEKKKRKEKKIGGFFDKLKSIGADWFESLDEDEENI
mgnify:CR=1 FL=1